jgi:hypothetical protein
MWQRLKLLYFWRLFRQVLRRIKPFDGVLDFTVNNLCFRQSSSSISAGKGLIIVVSSMGTFGKQ